MIKALCSCLTLLVLLAATPGCSGTSPAAKYGLQAAVPLVATRTAAYAGAAKDADVQSAAEELAQSVSVFQSIDVETVAAKWSAVRPAYLNYLAHDARYTEEDRTRMRLMVSKVDKLIDAERTRRLKAMTLGAYGTGTSPPATPTTVPAPARP